MSASLSASSYATVPLDQCASVDGENVHSADSLSWSPHNVLLVATHWAVFLHVKGLSAADAAVRPGTDIGLSAPQPVAGAKWALGLLPGPAMYPATCRLCVRATRDLFIYRVLRTGSGRVQVSAGAAIAGAGTTAVAYEWFPRDLLVVVTACAVHTVCFDGGETSDGGEGAPSRGIDDAKVFVFEDGLPPTTASRVAQSSYDSSDNNSDSPSDNPERLVVASVYTLRVFAVSCDHVGLLHTVDVPSLRGIPSTLCCCASSLHHGTGAVDVFVAAPLLVLRGTISPANSTLRWTTTASWETGGTLGDETCVRRLFAVPLRAVLRSPLSPAPFDGLIDSFVVLGLSARRLCAFVGQSCVELFRCLRPDAGRRQLPGHAPVELWGAAVHPSLALATLGLRFGRCHFPTVQLLPVAARAPAGFLARLLQLLLPQEEDSAAGNGGRKAQRAHERSGDGNGDAERVEVSLWNRQTSTSCFVWEELLTVSVLPAESARYCAPSVVQALRQRYLALREQNGVELFLRYDSNDAVWRQTLVHILRRMPGDRPVLEELLLANAIQVIASGVRYAGFVNTRNKQRETPCAVVGENGYATQGLMSAVEYTRLYCEKIQSNSGTWLQADSFLEQLGRFLALVESESLNKHIKLEKGTHFACSVCDKIEQVNVTLSLSSSSTTLSGTEKEKLNAAVHKVDGQESSVVAASPLGCADGVHYTVFSGTQFLPLSFLSQDEIVSRCCMCNTYDYVSGPFCGVCDGLML